jgi:hypothetical protein
MVHQVTVEMVAQAVVVVVVLTLLDLKVEQAATAVSLFTIKIGKI